jgi:hypothetical protein
MDLCYIRMLKPLSYWETEFKIVHSCSLHCSTLSKWCDTISDLAFTSLCTEILILGDV